MSEVDLTDIKQDGNQNPFDGLFAESNDQAKETPGESSPENKPKETAPSQEGVKDEEETTASESSNTPVVNKEVPLNKDKRWQDMRESIKQRDSQMEEMKKEHQAQISELKELIQSGKSQPAKAPKAFAELFGIDTEEAWSKWLELSQATVTPVDEKALEAKILKQIEAKQQEQSQAQKKQLEWVDTELGKLKEEGLKFEKNELLSILDTYRPTDENGYLDFRKGYELLQMANATKPANHRKQARKELAGKTASSGAGDPTPSDVVDLAKTRNKNWRDLV